MSSTRFISRLFAALTALLLAAGLFAWMNAAGEAINQGFQLDAESRNLDGLAGRWPLDSVLLTILGNEAYAFGDSLGWPFPNTDLGRGSIAVLLIAGATAGGLAAYRIALLRHLDIHWHSQYGGLRRNRAARRPPIARARLLGLFVAACLTGLFIAASLLASRSMGEDFESVLNQAADKAAAAAGAHYEDFGRLPSSLPDLPLGDRYSDVDGSTIEYCSQHAFGEHCTYRTAWDKENGEPFEVLIVWGLTHHHWPWGPQYKARLVLDLGILVGLFALVHGGIRSIRGAPFQRRPKASG